MRISLFPAEEQGALAELQSRFLESLGVMHVMHAPDNWYGYGQVKYKTEKIQARLSLYGFQGASIRCWLEGTVSMSARAMLRIATLASDGEEDVEIEVMVKNTAESPEPPEPLDREEIVHRVRGLRPAGTRVNFVEDVVDIVLEVNRIVDAGGVRK